MEIALLLFAGFVVLWTKEIFFPEKPKPKSPEAKLGEALANYLEKGIKIRIVEDDTKK